MRGATKMVGTAATTSNGWQQWQKMKELTPCIRQLYTKQSPIHGVIVIVLWSWLSGFERSPYWCDSLLKAISFRLINWFGSPAMFTWTVIAMWIQWITHNNLQFTFALENDCRFALIQSIWIIGIQICCVQWTCYTLKCNGTICMSSTGQMDYDRNRKQKQQKTNDPILIRHSAIRSHLSRIFTHSPNWFHFRTASEHFMVSLCSKILKTLMHSHQLCSTSAYWLLCHSLDIFSFA